MRTISAPFLDGPMRPDCRLLRCHTCWGSPGHPTCWDISVYPMLAWVPLGIAIDVDIPPFGGDFGGAGDIVDSRFDGAFLGGAAASNGTWRIEGDAIWASFGGDRVERPNLTVDLDVTLRTCHPRTQGCFEPVSDRRRAACGAGLRYPARRPAAGLYTRKPGVWNPLVGIGWHRAGPKVEWHASFEGGGFGVGADVDLKGTVQPSTGSR